MEGDQDPLADLFQRMFGGGRRRREGRGYSGGGGQDWGGWQNQVRNTAQNLQPNGAQYRGGPPAGAPRFAQANGFVFNNGFNPNTGFIETDPTGRWAPNAQQLSQMNWAGIPWQGSWADPNSPSFYLAQQGQPTPQDYFTPGQWRWGQGPADYDNGGWGADGTQRPPTGAQGGQPPPPYTNLGMPGGAQGGSRPPYPPGGNGPTGPGAPPSAPSLSSVYGPTFGREGNPGYGYGAVPGQTAANNWVPPGGNFNMYQGMPYAGGMGPYSGWLPPVPGIPTDYSTPPMGVDGNGYPIGGQVPGAPTGPAAPSNNYYDINSAVAAGNFPNYGNDAMQYASPTTPPADYTPNVQPNWGLAPSFAGGGAWG